MRISGVSAYRPARKAARHLQNAGQRGAGLQPASPAACTVGPSAIGSVNGMPISIRSAPAAGMPRRIGHAGRQVGIVGFEERDQRARPSALSAANRAAIRLTARRPDARRQRRCPCRPGRTGSSARSLRASRRRDLGDLGQRVRRFERGDDALRAGAQLEGVQRLLVGRARIRRGRSRAARHAPARCPDSPARR